MVVNSIECIFSELEVCIILLLEKSIKPLKIKEIAESLETTIPLVTGAVSILTSGLIIKNTNGSPYYELTEEEFPPYQNKFVINEKSLGMT